MYLNKSYFSEDKKQVNLLDCYKGYGLECYVAFT